MSTNNENINVANLPLIENKENIKIKVKASAVNQKPYSKNHIKVKLNQKKNPLNKGLNVIDRNNNGIKKSKSKNLSQKNIPSNMNNLQYQPKKIFSYDPLPSINPTKQNDVKDKKTVEKEEEEEKSKSAEKQKLNLNKDNINFFINKRESDLLLLKYGEDCYYFNKSLEKSVFKIPETLLKNHKISSNIRTKMVDWMVEVLSIFETMEETFFLSINIMDIFFYKTKKVFKNEDVHLIGITSMFISSKFQEIYPLTLKNFVHKVGHDIFSEEEIKKMECQIVGDIGLEVLVSTSVYDFLKTYFYDFYYNNKNLIKNNCDMKVYKLINLTAKYLSKLVVYYEYFYLFENSMKAIGCIVTSIKLVGFYLKDKFAENDRNIYNQWISFLLAQDNFDKQKIDSLVNKIYLAFNHYQKRKSIARNLNRFMKLPFLEKSQ
jgi:hypothetical protein